MAKSGLREKLTLILMVTTLVGVLLSGLGFLGIYYLVERQRTLVETEQLAGVVGENSRAAILFNIKEDAENILASLTTRPSIRAARVVNRDGELIGTYQPPGASVELSQFAPVIPQSHFMRKGLVVTVQIGPTDSPIGYVTVFDDLHLLHEHLIINVLIILGAALVAVLVAYILALRLRNIVASPVLALTQAAREVGRKRDYTIRVARTSEDEVGELVSSFNHMLAEIERRAADVSEARARAESRAEESEHSQHLLEREMSERQRAEAHERELQERLARAKRMESLGVLAGGVAHDLNNILGPLVGLPELIQTHIAESLKGDDGLKRELLQDLNMVATAAQRASVVIQDLMTLSRRGNYKRESIDMSEVIGHWLDTHEFAAIKKRHPNVTIETEIAPGNFMVNGSESHLARVISNLVGNAVEAADDGWVRIHLEGATLTQPMAARELIDPGSYVVLSVSDSGIGMTAETIGRIFEPFFTTKEANSRSGSGLGLAIVHGIIKDHEGYIDVESSPGAGTAFKLYIPRVPAIGPSPASNTAIHEGCERILVVDDEPSQRFLAKRTLERLGYTVETVANGHEAISMMNNAQNSGRPAPCDLVILDMIMEDSFDGLDTLREIHRTYPEMPTIIASGYAASERGQAALELGAVWISKPYEYRDLAKLVRQQLDSRQAPDAQQ
jgi:two-component system cell cycle sensor histidine kinase/response regulator CckA